MREINLCRILAAAGVVLMAGLLQAAAAAPRGTDPPTNACALSAQTRHEEGPGLLPADRAYLRAGTNQFSFLIPAGWKLETWTDGRAAVVTRDYGCRIVFCLARPPLPEGQQLDPDSCAQWILAEYPQARIQAQFPAIADSRSGPAYEIQLSGAGTTSRGEIAFIPSRAAVLEFTLICSPERFEVARRCFHTLMLTFRASDARGQLHISPLSDKL